MVYLRDFFVQMHYFILAGSHRPEAQSSKVAHRIEAALAEIDSESSSFLFDLRKNPLPLWNDRWWDKESDRYQEFVEQTWQPIHDELAKADALVVVCPEWSGMATPGVKNFFLFCGAEQLGNKPALLVTVSAGRGGRYPVAELRMSSYKNTQLCYIPQHVIVDQVEKKLNDHSLTTDDKSDHRIRQRLVYSLQVL